MVNSSFSEDPKNTIFSREALISEEVRPENLGKMSNNRDIYSLSPGFWQSFVTIGVHKDHIPALARFCKKQLTGFFVCLLFFLKVKHIS